MIINGNGILAESGHPALVTTDSELYDLVRAEVIDGPERPSLAAARRGLLKKVLGMPPGLDPLDLGQARWGVIWPPEPLTAAEETHRACLSELIDRRRKQMGGHRPPQFHYQDGWDYDDFLWEKARHVEPGDMKPDVIPYYLCIVGAPSRIPWEFQQYLDAEYAVGRIWFDDPDDCERYVRHLLDYERGTARPVTDREALLVAVEHEGDRATQCSTQGLVLPLADHLLQEKRAGKLAVDASLLLGSRASGGAYKARVLERLGEPGAGGGRRRVPSLLFFAGHGLEFDPNSAEQPRKQGSLICQDWPGVFVPPLAEHYLAADDISPQMDLSGLIAFFFACYSAGTPLWADWQRPSIFKAPARIAQEPFVARLPQKMLAGGALAFIGHVSKAWGSSFLGAAGSHPQIGGFTAAVDELLRGARVGHATDYLNARWLHLTAQLERWVAGSRRNKQEVIALWLARNDIRGYAVLGDPAARLRL